jgi:hypothetical protein
MQMGMHTTELFIQEPSSFEAEITIEKLKLHKSPGIDKILAELIQTGDNTLCSEIHKLINSILNGKNYHTSGRNPPVYLFDKKGDKTDNSNNRGIPLLSTTYIVLPSILL